MIVPCSRGNHDFDYKKSWFCNWPCVARCCFSCRYHPPRSGTHHQLLLSRPLILIDTLLQLNPKFQNTIICKKIGVYIRGVKRKNRNDCVEQWNLPHCKGSGYQIVKVQLSHILIDSHPQFWYVFPASSFGLLLLTFSP